MAEETDFEVYGEVDDDGEIQPTRPELIYIIGPIGMPKTKRDREQLEAQIAYAGHVEGQIVKAGYLVHSPYSSACCNSNFTDIPVGVWYAHGARWVQRCDAICMLPGWDESTGCALELTLARAWGKGVYCWQDSVGMVAYPPPGE